MLMSTIVGCVVRGLTQQIQIHVILFNLIYAFVLNLSWYIMILFAQMKYVVLVGCVVRGLTQWYISTCLLLNDLITLFKIKSFEML